ncbi:MAG: serine hydrolase domain-containing protein [Pirellulaceae bacterium]
MSSPSVGRHTTVLFVALAVLIIRGWAPAAGAAPAAAIPERGTTCDALVSFDRMVRSFLCENNVPGAAVAVARRGHLVYARGFGYADVERREPVEPDTLFRIASISKPLTAAAILTLADEGRLALDTPAICHLPQAAQGATDQIRDLRWHDVTVRHLLQHRGGWDREESFDPMFRSVEIARHVGRQPPAAPLDILQYMLSRQLDFEPGLRYAYSNFGYCLLGRVIEGVSGTDYETYVRREVLNPLGITRMRIGKTLPSGRADGEAHYYEPGSPTGPVVVGENLGVLVPRPYGAWYVEAMDAHGGWIASAVDLVRFASQLQHPRPSGILSRESWEATTACPSGAAGHDSNGIAKESYYGLGWSVRPAGDEGEYNLWHVGRFSGSSTLLVIRHDGLCWAVLFNTSEISAGQAPAEKIDPLLHHAADAVESWPECDLFRDFLQPVPDGS